MDPCLLRFEYVTDDAVYLDGLLIDDLSIPELDLSISPGDTWHSDGFSLAGDSLAQHFIVQIVQTAPDGSLQVSRLELDSRNHAETTLTGDDQTVVQVIQSASDGRPQVSRLELDDRNHAETTLTGDDQTVVVVSPITPDTRHSASYELEFRERP